MVTQIPLNSLLQMLALALFTTIQMGPVAKNAMMLVEIAMVLPHLNVMIAARGIFSRNPKQNVSHAIHHVNHVSVRPLISVKPALKKPI